MDPNIVIGVNEKDEITGYFEKLDAHEKGILHRAISVFIFNSKGEWLLQQRAGHKYHSGLKWSNTTCTHPMKGESALEAAHRRLAEEMGMTANLDKLFTFKYYAELDKNLIEHELDHIFIGHTDDLPQINKEEVEAYRYISTKELQNEIEDSPDRFTEWFKMLFNELQKSKKASGVSA
jgi:isopentenyl-diphosphate delta-isomerase